MFRRCEAINAEREPTTSPIQAGEIRKTGWDDLVGERRRKKRGKETLVVNDRGLAVLSRRRFSWGGLFERV